MPRPDRLLVPTVGVQWLVTVAVALWATRSGSVYGDPAVAQAVIDTAHGVASGTLPPAAGPLYPILLAPLARLTTRVDTASTVVTTLNLLVLAPLASYCLLEIARRIAGRLFAVAVVAVWLLGPVLAVPFFLVGYRDTYIDNVLPPLYGLTVQPVYPAMVLSLVAAVFALRAVAGAPRAGLVAGLMAGAAIAVVPLAAGVAGGVLLALAVARQWRSLGEAAFGLGAALVPTLVWRSRAPDTATVAFGHPTWLGFQSAMANTREVAWSNRLLQWLPVAGAIGMFRLMRPAVALAACWLAVTTVFWVATSPPFSGGRFFVGLIPTWPAYALLVAAIPAIVPTLLRRLGHRVDADAGEALGIPRAAVITLFVLTVVATTSLAALIGR